MLTLFLLELFYCQTRKGKHEKTARKTGAGPTGKFMEEVEMSKRHVQGLVSNSIQKEVQLCGQAQEILTGCLAPWICFAPE